MPDDNTTSESNYNRFIERVRESGQVWGLRGEDGWAYCESNEYEETDVLMFWSDRAGAQSHAQDEWSDHTPTEISLDEFIDNWLPGMDEDDALVGLDWTTDLSGPEIEPLDLADQLDGEEMP